MKARVKVLFDVKANRFVNHEAGRIVRTDTPKTYPENIDKGQTALVLIEGESVEGIVFVDAVVTIEDKDIFPIKPSEK